VLEAVTRVRVEAQGDAAVSETVTVRTEIVSTIAALIVIDRSNDPDPEADVRCENSCPTPSVRSSSEVAIVQRP
jgi:hypothetical protein